MNTENKTIYTSVEPTELRPDVVFSVDGAQTGGKVITNKLGLMHLWHYKDWGFGPGEEHEPHFQEHMPYFEYVASSHWRQSSLSLPLLWLS